MPTAQLLKMLALLGLGGVVAGYWFRVLQLAMRARRRIGQAANLFPPEPLGRVLRLIWTPAIVVWLAHPFISALLKPLPGIFAPWWTMSAAVEATFDLAAVLLAAACLAATTVCWRKMGKSWRMGINPGERTQLVASGPFAYIRHPIYALSIVMMLATTAAIRSPLMLVAASVHTSLILWESVREERYLIQIHGEIYARYRRSVGRFMPVSVKPYRAVCH